MKNYVIKNIDSGEYVYCDQSFKLTEMVSLQYATKYNNLTTAMVTCDFLKSEYHMNLEVKTIELKEVD